MTALIWMLLAVVVFWTHLTLTHWAYAAVMNYARVRDLHGGQVPRPLAPFAYPLLAIGLALDALLNVLWFTVIFCEMPREALLTTRLVRLKSGADGWRKSLASWVCRELLDDLDPAGCHCRPVAPKA